ncbi:hypothetical protein CDAR_541791 [Caerostris darwini]|uniref:Uncharacterized protein n=1 Tax=Caerostris darwini TaxID=1538125 RepID=A0AAV4UU10_9ARAC|nr:hypothetical protein CDAR_541791 [Caerostris darwini]
MKEEITSEKPLGKEGPILMKPFMSPPHILKMQHSKRVKSTRDKSRLKYTETQLKMKIPATIPRKREGVTWGRNFPPMRDDQQWGWGAHGFEMKNALFSIRQAAKCLNVYKLDP